MDSLRWSAELALAIECAVNAGKRFREEFCRPDGPRGERGAAVIDTEVERDVRGELMAAFPTYGYLGEETGGAAARETEVAPGSASGPDFAPNFASASDRAEGPAPIWIVDPNDGTSAFQAGYRGASVSIALVHRGQPVLGVVYAYNAPTDAGDLIAWAEGAPLRRWAPERTDAIVFAERRVPVAESSALEESAPPKDVLPPEPAFNRRADDYRPVLVSHKADTRPVANARFAGDRRFRSVVGIAYRLALTAVGEGAAAVTLTAPWAWDMAAGHALLRGAGMELYTAEEEIVSYDTQGFCTRSDAYFGGSVEAVQALVTADWRGVFGPDTIERQRNTVPDVAMPLEIAGRTLAAPIGPNVVRGDQRSGRAPKPEHAAGAEAPVRQCVPAAVLDCARGVLLGQCAGDSLGSLVEFLSPEAIAERYPAAEEDAPGPHHLADGGTFGTIAGQPTDDTEMALLLARSVVAARDYDADAVHSAYRWWLDSEPFDAGMTISGALAGRPNPESQANGALMRVSPLGIWGAGLQFAETGPEGQTKGLGQADAAQPGSETGVGVNSRPGAHTRLTHAARRDAELTHVHPNCAAVNVLFVEAIAGAIVKPQSTPQVTYDAILRRASEPDIPEEVRIWTSVAGSEFPDDYLTKQGWVRIAWQNALRQLLTADGPAAAIRDTVRRGGDTDTNAAICGALVGAVYGAAAFPAMWQTVISSARAIDGMAGVVRPRPQVLWPVDWEALTEQVLLAGVYGKTAT